MTPESEIRLPPREHPHGPVAHGQQLPVSKPDQLTVKAIVQIAHGLGKRTVAKFVDDDQTLKLLARLGVDFAQGYHTGKPVAVSQTWPPAAPEPVRSAPLD